MKERQSEMKVLFTHSVIVLALITSPFALSQKKHSAEHYTALKKCNDDYISAIEASRTLSEKDRKEAVTKAMRNKQQCIASAPE